jgi:hypothetical protein
LPKSLIGIEGYEPLSRVAARLPMELSSFWGFECRLGEPEPLADILFEIKKEALGLPFLAGLEPSSLDRFCETFPVWKRLRSLARNWSDSAHPWRRLIRNLWLEMDLAEALKIEAPDAGAIDKALHQPNLFFGPEQGTPRGELDNLIQEIMLLFERPPVQARKLREFLDGLPDGAEIFQVGFMLTREDDVGIRLCVDQVEEPALLPWLTRLLPDGECGLQSALDVIIPLCRHRTFGFNLTEDGIGTAIGVECYQDWLEENPAQWRPLLDELERRGLCLPEKARGVRDYAGKTASPLKDRLARGMIYLHTYRKIHHLKLTVARGALTQAKAYLAVSRPGLPLSMFSGYAAQTADQRAGQAWNIH